MDPDRRRCRSHAAPPRPRLQRPHKVRPAAAGGNGTGKSTPLAVLKTEIKNRAYYWPTADRLAFRFAMAAKLDEDEMDEDDDEPRPPKRRFGGARSLERGGSGFPCQCRRDQSGRLAGRARNLKPPGA
jgi:hypothetical protein